MKRSLFAAFLLLLSASSLASETPPLQSPDRGFVSTSRANNWEEAIVSGNGDLGAMVLGNPADETVIICKAGLWMPLEKPLPVVDTASHLKEIRAWMAAGEYQKAADFVVELSKEFGYRGKPWTDPLIPAFDLKIATPAKGEPQGYARSVDFRSGMLTVRYADERGPFVRRLFCSRPDKVIALSITAPAGQLDCRLQLATRPDKGQGGWWPEANFKNGIDQIKIGAEGRDLTYRSSFKRTWPGSLQGYEGVARVVPVGGTATVENGAIAVKKADELLILIKVEMLTDFSRSQIPTMKESLDKLSGGFDAMLTRQTAAHSALFERVRLDLGGGDDRKLTSEELLKKSAVGKLPPALVEREFDSARSIVISSSGTLYPSLQGIWNGTWCPPWSSDFTQNGNVQTAIAGDLCGNMPELLLPYFDYLDAQLPQSRENARRLYGCRGIHVASRTSSHGLNNHFDQTWPMTFWTGGAGWAAHFYYDYYLYTGDKDFFMKRALPFMKEAALFYEDFLIEDGTGHLMFSPSYSPENDSPTNKSQACVNATMDVAICRELLTNLVSACAQLKIEPESVAKWKGMLAKLPPYRINSDGAVQEWCWDLKDNYAHRHASHLYPLFDGMPADIAADPKLIQGFKMAVEKRMEFRRRENGGEMAFGLVQVGMAAASLRDGKTAYEVVDWLANQFWYPSMVSSHNVHSLFNVDICGGLPALVIHMLVQSQPGQVDLLPALPAQWPAGKIEGAPCRGQVLVKSLAWEGKTIRATLRSPREQKVTVRAPRDMVSCAIEGSADKGVWNSPDPERVQVMLPAGADVVLTIILK